MGARWIIATLLICALGVPARAETASFSVVGGLTRANDLVPGALHEGKLTLQNHTEAPLDIRLSQTDYHFAAEGSIEYDAPGTLPRSNAGWLRLTPQQVTLPAQGSATIFYALQVPEDPALLGTYWSVVMVEPLNATGGIATPPGAGGVQVGVRMIHRYAVQFVTTIGQGRAALAFSNPQVATGTDPGTTLQIDVANEGEIWLRPRVWVELFAADGTSRGRFEGNQLRLYPSTSGRFRIPLKDIPPGHYTALIVADSAEDQVFGTQIPLDIS